MTEKELLNDILYSFKLTKSCIYNLQTYEVDLICQTYSNYKKEFIYYLLEKARRNYNSLNNIEIKKESYSNELQYELAMKKKQKVMLRPYKF